MIDDKKTKTKKFLTGRLGLVFFCEILMIFFFTDQMKTEGGVCWRLSLILFSGKLNGETFKFQKLSAMSLTLARTL